MTKAQTTVIWIGLVLIAFNLIIHANEIKGVIFGGASSDAKPSAPSGQSSNAIPTPTPNPSPTPPQVQAI